MNCPYFNICHSCTYDLEDASSSALKKFSATKAILKPYIVKETIENLQPYHYRHKVIYHFAEHKGHLVAGFHPEKSNSVFEVDDCLIQNETASNIMKDLLPILRKYKLKAYNPISGNGTLRHILFRISKDNKSLICFVLGNKIFYSSQKIIHEITKLHPEIIGINSSINSRDTSVVMEGSIKNLYGRDYLLDNLGEYRFAISPSSFYQVNPKMAEVIYTTVINDLALKGDEKAVDAYCGIGTITLFAAKNVKEIKGIEVNPNAVKDAINNAKRNEINNASFIYGDAEKLILKEKADVLFVDPPRSGLSKQLALGLVSKGPKKIAYISCNPKTLKRDLDILTKTYKVRDLKLYDQFSFTDHLEASCILERIK